MDGNKLPRFFQGFLSAAIEFVLKQVYPESIVFLRRFFEIWANIAGIEPLHKV